MADCTVCKSKQDCIIGTQLDTIQADFSKKHGLRCNQLKLVARTDLGPEFKTPSTISKS